MAFRNRLKEARITKGMTQSALANVVGVSKATISSYESGNSEPDVERIRCMMSALDVDANFLWQDEMNEQTEERLFAWGRPILVAYKDSTNDIQKATCAVLSIPYIIPDVSPSDNEDDYDEADIFDYSSAAGSGNYVEASSTETMRFPAGTIPDGTDCGIRISGHSMEPDIHDGDIVWVQETCEILNHQVEIFIINGDNAVCKRAKMDENGHLIRLMSDNPAIPDIEVSDLESIRVFGHVLGSYTPE